MFSKKTKNICFALIFIAFMNLTLPAFAATYNAGTSIYVYLEAGDNNVQFTGSYHWAQSIPPLASITIVNNNFSANCNVKVDWYDSSNNLISTSNVSINGSNTITGPVGNTHFAIYGSCTDTVTPSPQPWSYIASETDSQGNILNFDVPPAPSGGGEPSEPIDISPVVDELQNIQNQISTMQGQLTSLQNQFNAVQGQLNQVIGQLDNVQNKLDTLDSHVVDTYEYLSTPRTSQPIPISLNQINFDPTPPSIVEPPQQPYKYDKQIPQMPPFVDSPGPLPLSPEPTIMEHDPAAQINQPIAKDPVIKENPLPSEPVTMDPVMQQDNVNKEQPIIRDPVIKESPLTRDPVNRDAPIQQSEPLTKENPYERTTPIIPEPPR